MVKLDTRSCQKNPKSRGIISGPKSKYDSEAHPVITMQSDTGNVISRVSILLLPVIPVEYVLDLFDKTHPLLPRSCRTLRKSGTRR